MKKWFSIFLSLVIFLTGFHSMPMKAEAASYASEWWLWDQRDSDDQQMRKAGCRVVAFAKMLKEAGMYGFENPDGLCQWGRKQGLITKSFLENGEFGIILKNYLSIEQGATAVDQFPKGTKRARKVRAMSDEGSQEIMELINQGYYVFLSRVGTVCHTVYIGREASLAKGSPVVIEYDGGRDFKTYNYEGVTEWDLSAFALSGGASNSSGTEMTGSSDPGAAVSSSPIVFNNVSHNNITENTAFLKTDVTADCTQLSDVGLEWGYMTNGEIQSMPSFNWEIGQKLTQISVDFGKEKDVNGNVPRLEPGRTVYYRFFATKKDGLRIYDSGYYNTFQTAACSHSWREVSQKEATNSKAGVILYECSKCNNTRMEYIPPKTPVLFEPGDGESEGTGAVVEECISFNSMTASNITERTAFVKAEVTADCSQLSAVGMEWGYQTGNDEIPKTEFRWATGSYLNFISVDFGNETDAAGNVPSLEPGQTVYYRFFADKKDGGRVYSIKNTFTTKSEVKDDVSVEPEPQPQPQPESQVDCIIFNTNNVSNITSNSAYVKADVTADCTQLSSVGMEYGYLENGSERPQSEFRWRTGSYLTYISVDFGNEKDVVGNTPVLEPGKTVYYRFYGTKKDGNRIYSERRTFVTQDAPVASVPSNVDCITFNTNTVSNITANSAFIKTDVTADCSQLSSVGMEWGYIEDGGESSRTEFRWSTGSYLTFISVDFGRERDSAGNTPVLEAGKMVYYRFFGTRKDGSRVYSETTYFETK